MGKIAELEKEVSDALEDAKLAIKNIKYNINDSSFSDSMDKWAKIIKENAQNKSGLEEWKSIKNKKDSIEKALNNIKNGVGNISKPTGKVTTSYVK